MPKDTEIESVLLTTLRNADFDTATLKSIREDVVKQLDLPQDFFKDKKWRQKSTDMADLVMTEQEATSSLPAPTPSPKKTASTKSPKNKTQSKQPKVTDEKVNTKSKEEDEEEEYSDVIDDSPPPQRKRRSSSTPAEKKQSKKQKPEKVKSDKKSKKSTRHASPSTIGDDPLEQKIATLKFWVVKCGVRKQWTKELQPFTTQKEKLLHLQKILADMGMTPRYSLEKAKRIKEEREFQREVAQLQADAKRDLSSDETEEREKVPPKKPGNIVAGNFNVDFLGDQSDSD
ncbi:uncharacterized protein V2V93DRAFT_364642 [Kockiozyma suomiensis]|uniref:uncharacterized protein n=1 Tax=Kockiozyma suomiensis TaxID=1337062 RepID=UPI003343ECBE